MTDWSNARLGLLATTLTQLASHSEEETAAINLPRSEDEADNQWLLWALGRLGCYEKGERL